MGRTETLFCVIKIFYYIFKTSGLCPYHYVSHSKKFQTAWYEKVISLVLLIIYTNWILIISSRIIITFNPQLGEKTFYLVLGSTLILYIDQCARAKVIASHLTDARDILMEFIQELNIFEHFNFWKTIANISVKIVFGFGIIFSSSYYVHSIISETHTGVVDHYAVATQCIIFSSQVHIPNIFYALIVGASIQYKRINRNIEQILKKAEHISKADRKEYRLNNNLKQEFDYLANLHGKLTELIMHLNGQFSIPLLFFYILFITALLIQVIANGSVIREY